MRLMVSIGLFRESKILDSRRSESTLSVLDSVTGTGVLCSTGLGGSWTTIGLLVSSRYRKETKMASAQPDTVSRIS